MNKKKIFGFELIYILILMFIFLISGTTLSEAGDMRIAEDVSSTYTPGFFLIGVVPGAILRMFAALFPSVNWWMVFSVVTLVVPLFILVDTARVVMDETVAALVGIVLGFAIYKGVFAEEICYTQNVALLAMAGFALILRWGILAGQEDNRCEGCRGKAKGLWMAIIGTVLVLLAGSCRWKALVMCLPFVVMIVGWKIIVSIFSDGVISKIIFIRYRKELLIIVMFVALVFGSAAIHEVYEKLDPYYAEYVAANELRRDMYDYPERYPDWEDNKEAYLAAGIERSYYEMVFGGYTVDMNNFSSEKLKVMKSFREASPNTFSDSFQTLKGHREMWIALAIIALLVLVTSFGSVSSFVCAIAALLLNVASVLACVYAFAILGRNGWRVMVGIIIASAVSFLFMSSRKFLNLEGGSKDCANNDDATSEKNVFTKALTSPIALIVVTALALFLILKDVTFTIPASGVTDEVGAGFLDYMDAHEDIAYLQCEEMYYYKCHGLWDGKNLDYCNNIFGSGGGFILGRRNDMARLGINDMVIDMLNKPNIYTFYNDVWHAYIWDYYGRNVCVGIVDTFEDIDFIRYVAPKAAGGNIDGITAEDVSMKLVSNESYNGYHVWSIEGELAGNQDIISSVSEWYVNVVNDATGDIYTYPLVLNEDNKLTGQCFYYDGTWSFGDTRRYVMGVIDGECYNLVDVSTVPVFEE